MKKVRLMVMWVLIATILVSCGNENHSNNDPGSYKENNIVLEGKYTASDESTLTITKTGEEFAIEVDIVGLTCLDDGVGKVASKERVEFSATDEQGNLIFGDIRWRSQDEVKLEITKSTWDYLPNGTVLEFRQTQNNTAEDVEDAQGINNVPYAAIQYRVLDATFAGYKNQTGATFFELQQGSLEPYYIKKTGDVRYYYGTNEVVVGVEDNEICLMTCFASDVVGRTSPQVRDLINKIEAGVLFEIQPAVVEVNNSYNSSTMFYWGIDNGYLGIITFGGNDPTNCYSYVAASLVFFEHLDMLGLL